MKKRGQKYQQNILEQFTFSLAINVKVKVGFQIFQKNYHNCVNSFSSGNVLFNVITQHTFQNFPGFLFQLWTFRYY